MLIDRPQVVEGSSIQNATVPSGASFPSSPNVGELFFLTSGTPGIYSYNGSGWDVAAKGADLAAHLADDARHLLPTQNTFLDGLNLPTLTASHVNFLAGTTSNIQGQLNAIVGVNSQQTSDIGALQSAQTSGQSNLQAQLDAHKADDTRHLTAAQNTLLDGITVDFTAINSIPALTGRVTTAEGTLSTHVADDTRHLTAAENTFLDGVTVPFAEVNKLANLSSYLGASTLATQLSALDNFKLNVSGSNSMTGNLNMGGQRIINVAPPLLASDAANKDYVDSFVQGLHWVGSARVASIQDMSLSGLQTIDGITVNSGDRVLVKNQTAPSQNGIWIAAAGAWSRANDFNSTMEVNNSAVFVLEGTSQGKSTWIQLSTVNTLGTDPLTWSAFSGPVVNAAGPGISLGAGGMVSVVEGAGLTFSGNAIVADIYSGGGLMTTTDNTNPASTASAQIALTNVGTAGTYKSVTTDTKGRVVSGTNPTTLAGFGITDAVNKGGDSMTGALNILGGTTFQASSPATNTAWWSSPSYGGGSGDGRTHFGYYNGTNFTNFIRGAVTYIDGTVQMSSGTVTVGGSQVWTQATLTSNSQLINNNGYITLGALTWGNITGKPYRTNWTATDSKDFVAGQLAWQNYGDGHTIFDASKGVNPLGNSISNTNAVNAWTPTFPTLMGFNGADTYGVRVDSSRVSDTTLQTTIGRVGTAGIGFGGYGSVNIAGQTGGYSGFSFSDFNVAFMINGTYSGVYRNNATWDWRWDNGTLAIGTVPAANISGTVANATNATNAVNATNATNATTANNALSLGGITSSRAIMKRRGSIQGPGSNMNVSISEAEMGFTYGGTGEPVGPFIAFGGLGSNIDYSCQLVGGYSGGGNDFKIRTMNGDVPSWNPWRTILTDGNYNSYSPTLTGGNASGTWGINITGNSGTSNLATKANTVNNSGNTMTFNWAGQGGQPTWLWGGNAPDQMYVYNPSNFSVNYANSAGSAGTANGLVTNPTLNGTTSVSRIIGDNGSAAAPTYGFKSDGGTDTGMYWNGDGYLAFCSNAQYAGQFSPGGHLSIVGNFYANGDVTAYSDERLKENWRDVSPTFIEQWARVKNGVFDRIDSGRTQVGLSAQSVQSVVPEAVNETEDGILTVNYGAVSAVATVKLAEEILELRKQLQMQGELIKLLMDKEPK